MKYLLAILIITLMSCSTKPPRTEFWNKPTLKDNKIDPKEAKKLAMEAMILWNKRFERISLDGAIKIWQQLSNSNAKNLEILVYLSRAHFTLGQYFAKNATEEKKFYELGLGYGEEALCMNKEYCEGVRKGAEPERMATLLTDEYKGALYWTAMNTLRWSKLEGLTTLLKNRRFLENFIERVEEISDNYHYQAVHRFWGEYYASVPKLTGGDLLKSQNEFTKAISAAPNFLANETLFCEYYLTQVKNKNDFKTLLTAAKARLEKTEFSSIPENILEGQRIDQLLKKLDQLF